MNLNDEGKEKTIKAGEIVRKVRQEAIDLVKPDVSMLEVAEFIERRIRELGGSPAFPVNISVNERAAHSTPGRNDDSRFSEGDLVKLDIGVHIDGWIADTAISVDLGDNRDLIQAAETALKNGMEVIEAGVNTGYIGEIIERTIREFNFKPVINLTGHGLMPYIQHAPPTIYNRKVERGVELEEGMIIAIEPFATPGVGKVVETNEVEIYSLPRKKPVRLPLERKLLQEIEKYKTLPFARRWIETEKSDFLLKKLSAQKILRKYPVLSETSGEKVSQAEHTVIVEEGGYRLVT